MLKIVISPAKKMNITDEFPCNATVPVFSDRADVLHGILKNKNIRTESEETELNSANSFIVKNALKYIQER